MKIAGEVIGVERKSGFALGEDTLQIVVRGREVGAAKWRGSNVQVISVIATVSAERTFHVGREVTIEVKAR